MKILFIGNSHTYMNDMPELTRQMIENATGKPCEVTMLAYSGRSIKWHYEEYFPIRFALLHGGYDYCVMQEQAHPLPDIEDTFTFAPKIIELCKKTDTTPVIFETWAEKRMPEHQAEMNRRYHKLASEQGALLAPIGEVWAAVLSELKDQPDVDLYFRDGEHASYVGDYLIAMVITRTITGKLPDEDFLKAFDFSVPEHFYPLKEDVNDELTVIPKEVAQIIRKQVEIRSE
jgi:hypothetical protein